MSFLLVTRWIKLGATAMGLGLFVPGLSAHDFVCQVVGPASKNCEDLKQDVQKRI